MSRTPTLPPTSRAMWRRLVACSHPDAGGDHELFIWTGVVRDYVCSERTSARPEGPRRWGHSPPDDKPRVPFPHSVDFEALTWRALDVAEEVDGILAVPMRQLHDCRPMVHLAREQQRGATYKCLAYIAHICGMSKRERIEWYRVAESIPLSEAHVVHILSELKGGAA